MSLKKTVQKQYQAIVSEAAVAKVKDLKQPKEGWVASVRNALGMSLAELGKRVNRTRSTVSSIERSEQDGRATIKSMNTLAKAMGCKFVYAFVPAEGDIEDIIQRQARKKAKAIVGQANMHMAFEQQALNAERTDKEIRRLTREYVDKTSADLWRDNE